MKKLKVDEEFRDLIPRLSKDEIDTLRESILSYGIRESLIVWKGHNIILDGHNRYKIATEENIQYSVSEYVFMSRSEVMVWMIDNQRGRRNLSKNDLLKLGMKRAELLEAKAKENQSAGGGDQKSGFQKSEKAIEPINTTKEMADFAGVSVDTASKYKKIMNEAPEEVKERVQSGTTSINRAYTENVQKKPDTTTNDSGLKNVCIEQSNKIIGYAENIIDKLSNDDKNNVISALSQWIRSIEVNNV